MRRKGISGLKPTETAKPKRIYDFVTSTMARISERIPPPSTETSDSATDKEDDEWDD